MTPGLKVVAGLGSLDRHGSPSSWPLRTDYDDPSRPEIIGAHTCPVSSGRTSASGCRQTFDRAAGCYDRVRPEYPEALFDDLIAVTGLVPGDHLLEVGCATGKATRPLARRGFRITCVELGAELAAVARQNLAGFQRGGGAGSASRNGSLVEPVQPGVRGDRLALDRSRPALPAGLAGASARRSPGHLDSRNTWFPRAATRSSTRSRTSTTRSARGCRPARRWLRPGELTDDRAEIEASGLFEVIAVRHYDWERVYPARRSTSSCSTRSPGTWPCRTGNGRGYTARSGRRLALRPDHSVRRHWGAVLQVARRREHGIVSTAS